MTNYIYNLYWRGFNYIMKIGKIVPFVLLLLIVILFPLNPYIAAFIAVMSLGIAFLIRRNRI
ncbi:hypothetical protein C6A30_09290 [Streptococcus anginosus]|nr:hypothetical protein C6A30_09290 [Streptococcus anginosus]